MQRNKETKQPNNLSRYMGQRDLAAFYSLAQTVNATFHGADPHMEYPLEETSYTLYLEHPQGESDLLVLTEGNLLFYHGLRYTLDSNALFSF